MPEVTIVYWRDMPAQVIVGRGRRAAKHPLPERFEQAIDRAAMTAGLDGSDDYLAHWRKGPATEMDGDPAELAQQLAAQIEADYPKQRLIALAQAGGVETD